jgi:hypothetical protein
MLRMAALEGFAAASEARNYNRLMQAAAALGACPARAGSAIAFYFQDPAGLDRRDKMESRK